MLWSRPCFVRLFSIYIYVCHNKYIFFFELLITSLYFWDDNLSLVRWMRSDDEMLIMLFGLLLFGFFTGSFAVCMHTYTAISSGVSKHSLTTMPPYESIPSNVQRVKVSSANEFDLWLWLDWFAVDFWHNRKVQANFRNLDWRADRRPTVYR